MSAIEILKNARDGANGFFPELPRPNTQSIFDYYSVRNEVNFAKSSIETGSSEADIRFYIQENVHRFLGEFAGQVPYTNLAYVMNNGALTYRGIDLTSSYERASENGEREHSEFIGFSRIQYAFSKGATTAVWISPPKNAGYGFVFYFSRDKENSNEIREHILRYEESHEDSSLSKSKDILKKIHPSVGVNSYGLVEDFLHNPLIGASDVTPYADMRLIMSAVGIDKNEVDASIRFERQMRAELASWISLYAEAVLTGDIRSAKKLLLASYNYAFDAHRAITNFSDSPDFKLLTEPNFQYYASQKRTVTAGSCPVSQNNFTDPFSPPSIIDQLNQGKTLNNIIESAQNFNCPGCDQDSPNPLPRNDSGEPFCPHCKITPKEAKEKGLVVCD